MKVWIPMVSGGRMHGVFHISKGVWLSMTSACQFQKLKTPDLDPEAAIKNAALKLLLQRQTTFQQSLSSISAKLKYRRKS